MLHKIRRSCYGNLNSLNCLTFDHQSRIHQIKILQPEQISDTSGAVEFEGLIGSSIKPLLSKIYLLAHCAQQCTNFTAKFSLLKKKKSMERISSLRRQDCPKAAHSQGRPNCPVTGVAAALPPGCARLAAGSMHKLRGNKSPHLEGNAKRFYSSCCCRHRCRPRWRRDGGDCCRMF